MGTLSSPIFGNSVDAEDGAEFLIDFLGSPVEWTDAAYVLDDCVEPFGPHPQLLTGLRKARYEIPRFDRIYW
jgi:hypothetical protein